MQIAHTASAVDLNCARPCDKHAIEHTDSAAPGQ